MPSPDSENGQNVQNPATQQEPEILSVSDLLEDGPSMPEVQAHTVEAAKIQKAEHQKKEDAPPGSPVKGNTDDIGRPFDPILHEVGPDGKPRLNKAGYLAKRRGGGLKNGIPSQSKINKEKSQTQKNGQGQPHNQINTEAVIQENAHMFTGLFLTCATMIGGEEFKPVVDGKTGENEPEFLKTTFANYFRAKGVVDIPPGLALTMGLGFYVAKRWNSPKFTERRTGWFGGVRRWWSDFRLRRKIAREKNNRVDAGTADIEDNPEP